MPKQRITKDMVVDAAFSIARERGMDQVLVKNIADKLDCSVQPIYSYCSNMESLKHEVIAKTREFFHQYVMEHMDPEDLFRSTGFAYIHLAKEEPFLFKLYFLRSRTDISSLQDLYQSESSPEVTKFIEKSLRLSWENAKKLHLHMIVYSMGLGAILATSGAEIPFQELEAQLESAYQAILSQMKEMG